MLFHSVGAVPPLKSPEGAVSAHDHQVRRIQRCNLSNLSESLGSFSTGGA